MGNINLLANLTAAESYKHCTVLGVQSQDKLMEGDAKQRGFSVARLWSGFTKEQFQVGEASRGLGEEQKNVG